MANINMNGAWTTDDSITRAELEAGVEAATVYDITQTNMKSDSRCDFVGTSAPTVAAGQIWHDTNTPATPSGPIQLMKVYDASGTAGWMGIAFATYSTSTPSATFEKNGILWWDKTLIMWRVYRDATYDPHGIAGWHPLDQSYQLVKNESGGSIAANRCVIWKAGGTAEWAVTTASAEKDPLVAGVTIEAIADASYGVIATVAGGARVDLYVDEATHALVKGDGIITASANGYGRSVGALEAAAHPGSSNMIVGTPRGCFARALGVTSSNLAPVQMLGFVGTGATAYVPYTNASEVGTPIWSDTTPAIVFTAVDFTLRDDGTDTGVQGASSSLISTKHAPLIAVDIILQVAANFGSGTDAAALFSKNNDNVNAAWAAKSGSGDEFAEVARVGWCPTSIGNGTAANNTTIGNKAFVRQTSSLTYDTFKIYMAAYIY